MGRSGAADLSPVLYPLRPPLGPLLPRQLGSEVAQHLLVDDNRLQKLANRSL